MISLPIIYCFMCALEFSEEAPGSVYYITEDGSISYSVILKAVYLIMLNSKEQNIGIQVNVQTIKSSAWRSNTKLGHLF